jgi:hypothetical protein
MLFKQEDLNTYDPIQEAADILNESVYLTEEESISSPITVPVITNERIGAHVVAFNDVERLAEDYSADYIDAMVAIAEANEISMDELAVSVPEWKIIANPEIVNELSNVIVSQLSPSHPVSEFCEACIEAMLEDSDQDFDYINSFAGWVCAATALDEGAADDKRAEIAALEKKVANYKDTMDSSPDPTTKAKAKAEYDKHLKQLGDARNALNDIMNDPGNSLKSNGTGIGPSDKQGAQSANDDKKVGPIQNFLKKVKQYGYTTPKNLISQAISKLKNWYTKIKREANNTQSDKRSIFQKIVHAIASAIDRLSNFLFKTDQKKKEKQEADLKAAASSEW